MADGTVDKTTVERKPVRVYIDGCYDGMHFGHANAIRQARLLGDYLVVGVHSDEEISKNKGPPLIPEDQRYATVRACRWVDEVRENAPYTPTISLLDELDIDFTVHGEDICSDPDGNDVYRQIKADNRFRYIKRTEGVSTTDVVGRLLDIATDMQRKLQADAPLPLLKQKSIKSPFTGSDQFLLTSRKFCDFAPRKVPHSDDKIVYIDGSWDMFHAGHIEVLKAARTLGTFLIVGVRDDSVTKKIKGKYFPVLSLPERVLSVMQCRYVDEVIVGAPAGVTDALLDEFKIDLVVMGAKVESKVIDVPSEYMAAVRQGKFKVVHIPHFREVTTENIVARVKSNLREYYERNRKKEEKENRLFGSNFSQTPPKFG